MISDLQFRVFQGRFPAIEIKWITQPDSLNAKCIHLIKIKHFTILMGCNFNWMLMGCSIPLR